MPRTKEYWWVSVGGNDCELALVVKTTDGPVAETMPYTEIFTFGCPDPLTRKDVVLVKELTMLPPDTPEKAAQRAAAWEAKRETDRKKGIIHGYRRFD